MAKLFENSCQFGNNWLTVEAVGTASDRDGIGDRIPSRPGR